MRAAEPVAQTDITDASQVTPPARFGANAPIYGRVAGKPIELAAVARTLTGSAIFEVRLPDDSDGAAVWLDDVFRVGTPSSSMRATAGGRPGQLLLVARTLDGRPLFTFVPAPPPADETPERQGC